MVVVLAATLIAATWAWARPVAGVRPPSTPTLHIGVKHPGNEFGLGAVGLSTEALELARGRLDAGSSSLVSLMRLLGPSVLRIGGLTVDSSWWTSKGERAPRWATNTITPSDLSILQRLLSATGWRVLLGVDFGHFDPARAADEASVAKQILGNSLLGIEIGNEPDDYVYRRSLRPATYGVSEYVKEAEAYARAIAGVAPGVPVYGPATTQTSTWLPQLGGSAQMFAALTQHFYGTSTCPGKPPVVPPNLGALLSPAERQLEGEVLARLASAAAAAGRPMRIGETNDTACMASPAVSPVFGSALWALDWALRASYAGVEGVNFHGNLGGVCGANAMSPICAPTDVAAHHGVLAAQPEYYGLLAASRLEGGRFVPTNVKSSKPLENLTTWATLSARGVLRVALLNMSVGGSPQPISIPMSGYAAKEQWLSAPSAEARGAISLGRSAVTANGAWSPRGIRVRDRRMLRLKLPAASALLVTLRPRSRRR